MATRVINDDPVTGAGNTMLPRNFKLKTVETLKMDRFIIEKIEILEKIKKTALAEEDFDQCKVLKSVIDKLKILGHQIYKMNQEKKLAIQNEDYEIAKQLKFQIEQIRETASRIGSIEQEEFEEEHPEMQGKLGKVGMGIADDTDEEAFGEIRENIMNQNRIFGNDDVVVPMHNADKAIDFNTVDESQFPELQ